MQMGFGVRMGLSGIELRFRLLLNIAIFCQSRRFAAYHEQGKGCLYLVCEADFASESRLCKAQTAAR